MIKRWIWDKITECHILLLAFSTHTCFTKKKNSTFRVSSDVSISIGTVAPRVFLSDQMCPAALILQVLKAENVSYQLYPLLLYSESCIRWWHTKQDEDEGADFERKASNLDAKIKVNKNSSKNKGHGEIKSLETISDTNNHLIDWENNSWWQTNHKSGENEP